MNVVICIVLASVSIITVKTIKRIPIHPFYRTRPDQEITEDISEADNKDMTTANQVDDANDRVNSSKVISGRMKFTEFILEVAKVLKTYDDNLLHEVFVVVDYVVWENMYKGCKSEELTEIRRYVSDRIGLLKDAPAYMLRQNLEYVMDVIINEDYGNMANLVGFVDSLYVWKHEKFVEVLLALVHRRISTDVDLAAILKHALETLVFDHYCHLDEVLRRELIKMIEQYWTQFASQRLNYNMGSSLNRFSSANPFTYKKPTELKDKKRGSDTLTEGTVQDRRNNDFYSDYSNENSTRTVMTVMSTAILESSHATQKPSTSREPMDSPKINKTLEEQQSTGEDMKNNDDFRSKNNTADENRELEVLKTIAIDQLGVGRQSPGVRFQANEAKRSLFDSSALKSTRLFTDSSKTIPIDKLINIGTLAKEINDMVSSGDQALRQGPNILNWNALLDTDFLGTMDGSIPFAYNIPPAMQENNVNGKKDVIISLKAKYQE